MTDRIWTDVDHYITGLFLEADPALDAALAASAAAGLPEIAVSPAQGKMLHLLARAIGARRILEIGTLGGYSTIWLARALPPGGTLVTLEIDATHADVARQSVAHAGAADRVDLRLGPALETLPTLASEAPFDLIFIDADKGGYTDYLEWVDQAVSRRHGHHRRQRRPRRQGDRSQIRRRERAGHPAFQRGAGARVARHGDGDPDGRRERPRRLCPDPGHAAR